MLELPTHAHRRILVIDDNEAIHRDFQKVFQPIHRLTTTAVDAAEALLFGAATHDVAPVTFEVEFATQGAAGLERVRQARREQRPYAMAFVDGRMPPGWDGVETIGKIWAEYPDLQVVLCTAYSDYTLSEILKRLGLCDRLVILKKPFDNIEVLQLAYALTEKWRLLQATRTRTGELEQHVAARTAELQTANEQLHREIAERKRAEEYFRQSQKMEAIGQLAGGVAHDFNNMLTVIRGYAQCLLAHPQLDHTVRGPMQQIDAAAERAANLTRQLLAFSRKQVLQPEPLQLPEVIQQLAKMLRRILGEDIALEIHTPTTGAGIVADRAMLEQVLLNLVVNARDAMPRGGQLQIHTDEVELTAATAAANPQARAGKFIRLQVVDAGCGIAPEVLPRIFEPFFTTKESGKGTGLGLATVYGVVKQHEGWIEVTSTVNQGTTFNLFFPANLTTVAPPSTQPEITPASGGRETILLVEDEPSLRKLTRTVLERYGYRVITAVSGPEALQLWSQHATEVDLLLTDMVMPGGISGYELAQRLLAQKTGLKVIYSTGYSLEMADRDAVLQPTDHFLSKPYTPEKLATAVRNCLDGILLDSPASVA
jgi:two-component system, NtrC family, sensor kinase